MRPAIVLDAADIRRVIAEYYGVADCDVLETEQGFAVIGVERWEGER